MHKYIPCETLLALSMSGQALNSVVAAPPTVSIKAEKDPSGGSGRTFVLERDSNLGISGTDYAQPATIQTMLGETSKLLNSPADKAKMETLSGILLEGLDRKNAEIRAIFAPVKHSLAIALE